MLFMCAHVYERPREHAVGKAVCDRAPYPRRDY